LNRRKELNVNKQTTSNYEELDSVKVELTGTVLIEAAAGTGKTFNIQTLAARMLLEKNLPVDSLVIVTFTEKAAAELSERLRLILEMLNQVLHDKTLPKAEDNERINALIEFIEQQGVSRDEQQQRLQQALRDFDDNRVSTIHGFCARVLSENAFESSIAFRVRLEQNIKAYQEKLLWDYCRIQRYCDDPLPGAESLNANNLMKDLSNVFRPGELNWQYGRKVFSSKDELLNEMRRIIDTLKLKGDLADEVNLLSGTLNKTRNQPGDQHLQQYADEFAQLCTLDGYDLDKWYNVLDNLTLKVLLPNLKAKPKNPNWANISKAAVESYLLNSEAFAAINRFCELYSIDSMLFLKLQAREFVIRKLAEWKVQENFQDYDDLIIKVAEAVKDKQFCLALQKKFKAAVIDEFQDTDPLQYSIFKRLFIERPDPMFFMVGDPRQAIYSFRNGDLATYLMARQECLQNHGRVYSLNTNYRSSAKLIAAFNDFFAHPDFFASPDIRMNEIKNQPHPQAGIRYDQQELDKVLIIDRDNTAEEADSARSCANNIARMLSCRKYQIPAENGKLNPLAPGDIAVLARDNRFLNMVRRELEALGIPVVGDRKSGIWESAEAQALAVFLQAVLDNSNTSLLRQAMLTCLGNQQWSDLDVYRPDAADRLLAWQQHFSEFEKAFRQQGIAGMLQKVFHKLNVKCNLIRQPGGERSLANITQLGDLLASAERNSRLSPQGVLKYLLERIRRAEFDEQSAEMLESDRSAVTLMTIHGSKGLQFPVVFLPHLGAVRHKKTDGSFQVYHNNNQLCCNPDGALKTSSAQSALEDLQELNRLLYVAVTRAQMFCFISWGRVKRDWEQSALAWLFGFKNFTGEWPDNDSMALGFLDFAPKYDKFNESIPESMQLNAAEAEKWLAAPLDYHADDSGIPAQLQKPEAVAVVHNNFRMISYSSLPLSGNNEQNANLQLPESADGGSGWDDVDQIDMTAAADNQSILTGGIWDVPGSNLLGNVWHSFLEKIDFTQPLPEKRLAEAMRSAGFTQVEHHAAALDMFQKLLLRPLPCGLALQELPSSCRANEFEFMLNVPQGFAMEQLCEAVNEYYLQKFGVSYAGDKNFVIAQGMFNGFIDMIFQYKDKFYIVDWKSNKLNCCKDTFTNKMELQKAMHKNNYPMQYLCYLAALMRFLEQRMNKVFDEDLYEKYVGDVYYIFLRGCCLPEAQSGIFAEHVPFKTVKKVAEVISVSPVQ